LSFIKQKLDDLHSKCSVDLMRISSPKQLADVLKNSHYDVLLLSAHGINLQKQWRASLLIGNSLSMLDEVEHLPPIVFLSACHTAPRGKGVVSVADLLLRKGARVILATLVPVRVDRASMLMLRLLLYMEQAASGNEPLYTLDEALHKALNLNAVHDYETMSRRSMDWMSSPYLDSGRLIINEFKHHRSIGRLRSSHIYKDTEEILLEIARETGDENWVRATLSSKSFFPESAFYVLIGRSDDIVLQLTDFQKQYKEIAQKPLNGLGNPLENA
jgi:hypothetical protein